MPKHRGTWVFPMLELPTWAIIRHAGQDGTVRPIIPTLVTNSKASGGWTQKENSFYVENFPCFINIVLEIRPMKIRSGSNTDLHRDRQGAEQLFTRYIFLLFRGWDWWRPCPLCHVPAASNGALLCSASWKDYWMPKLNVSGRNPFLLTKGGEKPNKSSTAICVNSFFWEIVHIIHNGKGICINKLPGKSRLWWGKWDQYPSLPSGRR